MTAPTVGTTFGYSSIDNSAAQAATAYKNGYYTSGNLLFKVAGSLNVGVEYLYGSHEQNDGGKGTANRVQFAAKKVRPLLKTSGRSEIAGGV